MTEQLLGLQIASQELESQLSLTAVLKRDCGANVLPVTVLRMTESNPGWPNIVKKFVQRVLKIIVNPIVKTDKHCTSD